MLKRIQYLPAETANCALHILLETQPVEAKLDTMVMSLYVRVLHVHASKEKAIVIGQLSLKDLDSASWTQKVRKILLEASNNSSLRYLNYDTYAPGKLHHIWASAEPNRLDIKKAQVKARLLR